MGIVTMLELLLGRVTASGLQLCHVAKVSWHDRVREVPAHVLLQAFEVPFEVWEEAASRHVSLQAQTQPLKAWETSLCFEVSRSPQFSAPHRSPQALVVSLRERQLLEWKGCHQKLPQFSSDFHPCRADGGLRQIRERFWERSGSKWWLHLIGVLSEVGTLTRGGSRATVAVPS